MSGSFGADIGKRLRRLLPAALRAGPAVVPVVRLSGTIGIGTPLRPALTIASVAAALERAFSVRDAREVAIVVNSPGGAAAQAHLIYRRIRTLAEEKGLQVTAFVEDAAASGGYMIACAADEIVADRASIVGSIGVVTATFGFDKLMEKIGVERRLYVTGEKKSILDPFLPERPEDLKRIKTMQRDIQALFTELVRERRAGRLAAPEKTLFSGEFWVGDRARTLGLVDGVGDIVTTMKARYGEDVELLPMSEKQSVLRRLLGGGRPQIGLPGAPLAAGLAGEIVAEAEVRALWARIGL
jgi:signal peptide peptidase SppA